MCFERVRQLICEQLGKAPEKVTMETRIVDDLGADSLDVVEMLMSLEDEYGISLPDEVAMKLWIILTQMLLNKIINILKSLQEKISCFFLFYWLFLRLIFCGKTLQNNSIFDKKYHFFPSCLIH